MFMLAAAHCAYGVAAICAGGSMSRASVCIASVLTSGSCSEGRRLAAETVVSLLAECEGESEEEKVPVDGGSPVKAANAAMDVRPLSVVGPVEDGAAARMPLLLPPAPICAIAA